MFDRDRFIEDCRAALKERTPHAAIQDIVARAMSEPNEVIGQLGAPETAEAGTEVLHRSDDLTVLRVIWAPMMQIYPHDHRMWAVIGIYGGQEDNAFYRRRKDEPGLEQVNARTIEAKETLVLGQDAIHAVTNPKMKYTGAIHVYGGDFFATQRSQWDSAAAPEMPYDIDRAMRVFAEANEHARELLRQQA
jgi:predicted metal-dependent enzyme (double-stranded beta helix superfamily)